MKSTIFILSLLISTALLANIDPGKILFGHEATFQDQAMVDEPGRLTYITPHKKEKFDGMIKSFLEIMGNPPASLTFINSNNFKPGIRIELPNKDTYIVDMEPVCIEWNQRPLKINEIEARWAPVYAAAARMNLVPYVNPAAERSGMGHIHVGGKKLSESPFFANPLLLRNVMVYFHQHPSLLWGFAEAFDIGRNSNIETFHIKDRQEKFEKAVAEFDSWYQQASKVERVDGAFKFLEKLLDWGGNDFFHHYRYINLEHIQQLAGSSMAESGEREGKFTVEFRNIRPYKSPRHAAAMAQLLLDVFKPLAKSDYQVPFRRISNSEYLRFQSGLVTADDWTKVKAELGLKKNALLESMMTEYTTNLALKGRYSTAIKNLWIAPTYSEKVRKGTFFELTLPFNNLIPHLNIVGENIDFQLATAPNGNKYWVTVAEVFAPSESLDKGVGTSIQYRPMQMSCKKIHQTVGI